MKKNNLSVSVCSALNKQLRKDGLKLGVSCGFGSFGDVYKVYKADTGELFGVVKAAEFSDDEVENARDLVANADHAMRKETEIMKILARVPNAVSIKKDIQTFRKNGKIFGYFVMEPLISLQEADFIISAWIKTYGVLPVLAFLGYGISSALFAACNQNKVFSHRDIKPQNIFLLLTPTLCLSRNTFKLGDFGISNYSAVAATHGEDVRNRQDVFRYPVSDGIPTIKSDIYSLGCVIAYYANIPFNDMSGSKSFSDYGKIGMCVEKMLLHDKSARPSPEECMKVFSEEISKYEKKIRNDELVCETTIRKLNEGRTEISLPQDKEKAKRYSGIRDWLRGDLKSAKINLSSAPNDAISQFYLASLDVKAGKKESALKRLLDLRTSLENHRCHPIYDNVLALLFSLDYPLSRWEKATAAAVLQRDDNSFTFY